MGGNNPETQQPYFKKWREDNREKYLQGKRDHYRRNKDKIRVSERARRLRNFFGLTVDQYEQMLNAQGGVCAICRRPERRTAADGQTKNLAVDHDAKTGAVRGLLCGACNTGIGLLEHEPEFLERAAAYLEGRFH